MHMSENGRKLLAEWEGTELKLYQDAVGLPTIGVGHLLTKGELTSGKIVIRGVPVRYQNGLALPQALDLLEQDLESFESVVTESVVAQLKQNQFDAIVSFVFNTGISAFKGSTLLKVMNQNQFDQVPVQLRRWVYAGGRVIPGLANRREKEIALWLA